MTGSVSSFQQNKNEKLISTFSPRISRKTAISNAETQNGEFRKSTGDDQNVQNRNQNRDMGVSADQVSITTLIKLDPVQGKNNRVKKSMVAPTRTKNLQTNPLTIVSVSGQEKIQSVDIQNGCILPSNLQIVPDLVRRPEISCY